jgi:hypothetical protein
MFLIGMGFSPSGNAAERIGALPYRLRKNPVLLKGTALAAEVNVPIGY